MTYVLNHTRKYNIDSAVDILYCKISDKYAIQNTQIRDVVIFFAFCSNTTPAPTHSTKYNE